MLTMAQNAVLKDETSTTPLTREISYLSSSELYGNKFFFLSNAFTNSFKVLLSFAISKDSPSFILVSAFMVWQYILSVDYKIKICKSLYAALVLNLF